MKYKLCLGACASALTLSIGALAVAQDAYFSGANNRRGYSRAGHGEISLTYQHSHTNGLKDNVGVKPVGTTDTHAVEIDIDFNLTDRLSLTAGVPYITKRHKGTAIHNPASIVPPQNSEFIDDGKFHSDFQDAHIGARYLVIDKDFKIEPFVTFSFPTNDYPFFASAAVGQHRKKLEIGSSLAWYPPLDLYFASLSVSRVFVERTLGRDTDHWRVGVDAGYFVKSNLVVRADLEVKQGGGLVAPDDFPSRTDILWYHHDQLLKHNFINAGVAVDWLLDDKLTLTAAALRQIHSDNIFILKYALSFTATRSF